MRVAQELAQLSPCRPGISFLVRRTGLSERSVEYQLQMLREAGLLAYVTKGTRVCRGVAQASEFARMIPPAFDQALGIRTVGEGTGRRMTGIAETGRELMARLAKKAARKVRTPRTKPSTNTGAKRGSLAAASASTKQSPKVPGEASAAAVSQGPRCTPMGGGSSTSSSAGTTYFPPENSFASGEGKSPTQKKSKAKAGGRRRLNKIGRRYQLARELIEQVDWLHGCSIPRIAWVARHVADAGWTVAEVRAWLHQRGTAACVRRPSGLLAVLLTGAETVRDTPAKRADAVAQWHAAQEAARRHRIQQVREQAERLEGAWQAPTSPAVQREVTAAFTAAFSPSQPAAVSDTEALPVLSGIEDLDPAEIARDRAEAWQRLRGGDTDLITGAIDSMGHDIAEHLYGTALVHRALQLAHGARSALMTYGR
ncbi:transcriptional regulator [Streptomyces sp. N35]|uniref:transcriptional regulator n=1 Tax=Streptomyces sp. N35 TaxID=2795730 RepID=UPI0027DDD2F1|nr:transcriptional regulator [Streptomyces sp. N35]